MSPTLTSNVGDRDIVDKTIAAKASKALVETLENAIAQVTDTLRREHGIAVHSMLTGVSKQSQNLHLSLSRPIQLWTGQRGAFSSACLAAMMGVKRLVHDGVCFDQRDVSQIV